MATNCMDACPDVATESPAYSDSSASSVYSNNAIGVSHGTGRLDSAQAWSAIRSRAGEWWQMDLGSVKRIEGVVTQGRAGDGQYVKSYKVVVSTDSSTWMDVDGGTVFAANSAANNVKVENKFGSPVAARYVRIVVQTWQSWLSMRAAVLVCAGALPSS